MVEDGFLMLNKKLIVVTGSSGRFGKALQNSKIKIKIKIKKLFPTKKQLNILNINSIYNYLNKKKPKYVLHLAGLSRPMSEHDTNIEKSINLNIIGTANMVVCCSKLNIKLIYFSTSYVYDNKNRTSSENDPVFPKNNYAWSKLGGESAVQMYKNSLILRVSMTEKPFVHKEAFKNVITNFMYHDDVIKILPKILEEKGVLNIGGKTQSVYNFVKKDNPKVKGSKAKKNQIPFNSAMNISKLKKIINEF
jgi:dTDP-4-dehydrorhamnose reductase